MAVVPAPAPALHSLTSDDRGGLIIIIAYSWVFITASAVAIRFGLAWSNHLRLKRDDFTFALGVILAVASSVCYHIAANNGLGKKMTKVSPEHLDSYYKSMYAGDLLTIFAQWLAKLSFLQLSDRVAPREARTYNLLLGSVTFWGVFSILAIAFQCGLPEPWVYIPDDCPTKGILWYPIIVINIITDVVLATWILPTLWRLLMGADRRLLVVLLFGSRLIVACFAIVQLTSVSRHIRDADVTYESFGRVLWALCVTHLSILQATIPRTKKFVAALNLRTHATARLTPFELKLPTTPLVRTLLGKTKTPIIATPETSSAPSSKPSDVVVGRDGKAESQRQDSHAQTSSTPSELALVDGPLQLTPSAEQQCITTSITSPAPPPAVLPSSSTPPKPPQKYDTSDWKKYLRRSATKGERDMGVSSMFSWKSRGSVAGREEERIVQTREVVQRVERVVPVQGRWVMRRRSGERERRRGERDRKGKEGGGGGEAEKGDRKEGGGEEGDKKSDEKNKDIKPAETTADATSGH